MGRFDDGFAGKVALITGGASGIGLATGQRLAEEGAEVFLADVAEERGRDAAADIGASFIALDVSSPEAWRGAIAQVMDAHGGLDLAYLNAGVTTYVATGEELMSDFDISELPDESYRRIMGANVDGVILGTRAVVPAIRARGGGAILATASAAGVIAFPPDPVYTATKHAVVGFVRAQAPWLIAEEITCNAILPGVVDTNILADGFADRARALGIGVIPPAQIADAVIETTAAGGTGQLWLCLPGQAPYPYAFEPVRGLEVDFLEGE